MPYIYQIIIDKGVVRNDVPIVWKLFLVQLSFFIGFTISNTLSSYIISKINFHVSLDFVEELLHKLMRLPIKYFETRLNSEFIQRLDDFTRLRAFLSDNLINLLFSAINAIVYLSLLFFYSKIAAIVFIGFSSIGFIWNQYYLNERKFIDYSLFINKAINRNLLYEIINGMPDIKANNAQTNQVGRWRSNQRVINDLMLRQMGINFRQNVGTNTINKLRDIIIICFCCIVTAQGDTSLGVLMSVSYILGQLGSPFSTFQSMAYQYQQAKISADRLAEVQTKEEEHYCKDQKICAIDKNINLKEVSFKYEGSYNSYIIKNLSISFRNNETTAIVGNSGSGKTTLLKLILGFYLPQEGSISIGDNNLSEIDVDKWRQECGVVLQDGKIFSGTIAENIALGDENINFERVEYAARMACINEFISRSPGKYNMKIGSSGIELSQGQKQRILIARAIYKNPHVLIFDEATSSLDTVNEKKIMDNLRQVFKNKTVIIIAHRLSTVANADNIIYLEDGVIAEQGNHQSLVSKRGKYYELIKNQLELEG